MNKRILGPWIYITALVIFLAIPVIQRINREPLIIHFGILIGETNLEGLTKESDLIVIGKIDEAYPSRWNTPSGKLPWLLIDLSNLTILSDYNFQITQTLKGVSELASIDVRTFSGKVGEDQVIISAEETYDVGQRYLLFLVFDTGPTADINPGHYLATGGRQGVIVIPETGIVQTVEGEWKLEELIEYIQHQLQ